jgi:hypothetical protein
MLEGLNIISNLICQSVMIDKLRTANLSDELILDMRELQRDFSEKRTDLYSKISSFQARLTCQLSSNDAIRYFTDVTKANPWGSLATEVKASAQLTEGGRKTSRCSQTSFGPR